ncbi:MAG: hypothetical protein WD187_00930 [Candidatus Woykebacteria bacterium]
MKDIWTKVITSSAAAGASVLLIGTAALASTASNTNTGADSVNKAEVSVENNTTINSTNNANITNNISVKANTGKNEANKNTGDASIQTGDISGHVNITNKANGADVFNTNTNLICCGPFLTSSNENTGADSVNKAETRIKNNLNINVNNNVDLQNNIGADLNTGENEANKNTGDASIKTGDINFEINIDNDVNHSVIGGPLPDRGGEPMDPGDQPTAVLPGPAPRPGQVLAAAEGLPVTGGNLPNWPLLLIAVGVALKIIERVFGVRLLEKV